MSDPIVSVVMAAYKGAAFVRETIASLIDQSLADWELVVVDDCSPDDTLAMLRGITDPRVRVIASPANAGPVHARNRAFALARGRYIAALDQDDVCHRHRFARQVDYLDRHPDIVLVGSDARVREGGATRAGRWAKVTTPALLDWQMLLGNPLVWSTVMFRAAPARALDPFTRPERLFAEDFDLYHRLRRFGRIARIDLPLLDYRVHPGGASLQFSEKMYASATQVLAEAYAPLFGAGADTSARLAVTHLMGGLAVPNRATLDAVIALGERVRDHVLASGAVDAASRALIEDAHSRLWWRLVRTALRAGGLGLQEALAVRPPTARLIDGRPADLALSSLVGRGRRRLAGLR